MNSLIYLLILGCLSKVFTTKYELFISKNAIVPYQGTKSNPDPSIYSSFSRVANQYKSNAFPYDEFYFNIVPSQDASPYYLTDEDVVDGKLFKDFLGICFYGKKLK